MKKFEMPKKPAKQGMPGLKALASNKDKAPMPMVKKPKVMKVPKG